MSWHLQQTKLYGTSCVITVQINRVFETQPTVKFFIIFLKGTDNAITQDCAQAWLATDALRAREVSWLLNRGDKGEREQAVIDSMAYTQ